jgi:hypothetical protein
VDPPVIDLLIKKPNRTAVRVHREETQQIFPLWLDVSPEVGANSDCPYRDKASL